MLHGQCVSCVKSDIYSLGETHLVEIFCVIGNITHLAELFCVMGNLLYETHIAELFVLGEI